MASKYLTLDYLKKLLQFIIEEHIEFEYGPTLNKHERETLAKNMYDKMAEVLGGDTKHKSTGRKGQHSWDERKRLKIVRQLRKNHPELSLNKAIEKVVNLFPSKNVGSEGLVKRLQRANRKYPELPENPMFNVFLDSGELDIDTLKQDAKEQYIPEILRRIEQKLMKE